MIKNKNMKHKNIITAFLFFSLLSALFWRTVCGEVFAQQLSPRYIKTAHLFKLHDTIITFETVVPTNVDGEMVGVANGYTIRTSSTGGTVENDFPFLYWLDSTGKYKSFKAFEFIYPTGFSGYYQFERVIPFKDGLYIFGYVNDNHVSSTLGDGMDSFILKTDASGTVIWKKMWGDFAKIDGIGDAKVCSDGGLAFSGIANIDPRKAIVNPDSGYYYTGQKATFTKYNSDGTLMFNKAYQVPYADKDFARTSIYLIGISETPDGGYLLAGTVTNRKKYKTPMDTVGTSLILIKTDGNGKKLWSKEVMFNYNLQRNKYLEVSDMIPHPEGGYLLVGHISLCEWDTNGTQYVYVNGQKKYYNYEYTGGLMMKISELGDVEWIKSFRNQVAQPVTIPISNRGIMFANVSLFSSNGSPTGFVMGGGITVEIPVPIHDSIYPFGDLELDWYREDQTVIVKTDLNGNLLWDREYGALVLEKTSSGVYEEPGGSLIVNTFASPSVSDKFVQVREQAEKGVLRLNSNGSLGDPMCSLSPILAVYDDDILVSYDEDFVLETTPVTLGTIPSVVAIPVHMPTSTSGVCGNAVFAAFTYRTFCNASGNGSIVEFSNYSRGASLFHYDFGDTESGAENVSDSANVRHVFNKNGTYTVTLTVSDGDGSKTDTYRKQITITTKRNIAILPGDTTICQGSPVKLAAIISSGYFTSCFFAIKKGSVLVNPDDYMKPYSYTDTTFSSLPLDTTLSFYLNTFGNNCVVSDTVVVKVIPTIHMSVKGNTSFCAGDSSLLIASGSNTYLWNPGNNTNDSLEVHTTATYTVSSGQTEVCGTDTATIKITVNSKPIVDAGNEQTIYPGQNAALLASGGINYIWSPVTGLNSVSIANPTSEPEQTTTYTVTITDANGCVNFDSVIVYVKFCGVDLFVPTAFSPNDDNENDILYIKTLNNNCIQTIDFKIFDRWGNKVFESMDINVGWDGTYKGKAMNTDIFVYYLNAALEMGEVITKKGNISLIR